MDCRNLSWGRFSELDPKKDNSEEINLVHEWREWNSDLKIGENLVKNSKVENSRRYGENIVIKCQLEMSRIAKRLKEIRSE